MIGSLFSLRKPKRTFRQVHRLYSRKSKSLDPSSKVVIAGHLLSLKEAILQKDPRLARQKAKELELAASRLMPKNTLDKFRDFLGGIGFALLIAVLIRTTWFELYTIPSGSMRPTLKEEDYLVVSKTDYGINVPLQEAHFYFDPDLVRRGSIVVFNGANMDIADSDTVYFYLFPGKKQFVKRLIGKPGDTIYFYGGKVYGIDAEGHPLADLDEINQIEHIPFIRFEGQVETPQGAKNGLFSSAVFHQMNIPVAKLVLGPIGKINGEMLRSGETYSDLWGMKHFAMARLLTPGELQQLHPNADVEKGLLYLELTHHPTLQGAQLARDEMNRLRPDLAVSTSILPLQAHHLEEIAKHMTTCRFSVKNGKAWRLGWNPKGLEAYLPTLEGIPNGTYELQDGKAYRLPFPRIPIFGIFTNGYTRELDISHPLYRSTPEQIHRLFNLGIEFLNQYLPSSRLAKATPSRYAYFKEGDLYLLGAPILRKDDPTLLQFLQREKERERISTSIHPYFAFSDAGPPSPQEIRAHGIRIPDKMYLALGDNHAMSADSRQFGFVPEENLKGGVSFLFAPPGPRWGRAPQPPLPHTTLPNLTIWTLFIGCAVATTLWHRKKLREYSGRLE